MKDRNKGFRNGEYKEYRPERLLKWGLTDNASEPGETILLDRRDIFIRGWPEKV
jgi:hypothetical protein